MTYPLQVPIMNVSDMSYHPSRRCGSRTRGPNGAGISWGKRVGSRWWHLATPMETATRGPHRWAQPPWSWGTATACRLRMTFTITTTTPKPHKPSASETCTSHPVHRAERDTVPTATPQPPSPRTQNVEGHIVYIRRFMAVVDSVALHDCNIHDVSGVKTTSWSDSFQACYARTRRFICKYF